MLILGAVSAFETGPSRATLCNILLLYVEHSHVSWMWIWAFWALDLFELRCQLFVTKLLHQKKQKNSYIWETRWSICNLYACVCLRTNVFFFRLTPEPDSVASTETIRTVVHPHPPPYHRGLKTSINVGTVDNGFSFYEMKCDRIM